MNFWGQFHLYVGNMRRKFQVQEICKQNDMEDSPTWISCQKSFTAANFDTLPRIEEIICAQRNFGVNFFDVGYMCENFQVQKIHIKKHIQNLATCVVVKNISLLANFNTLSRIGFFVFAHEIFGTVASLC